MHAGVAPPVRVAGKGLAARAADVGLLARVHAPGVHHQRAAEGEAVAADLAAVRLFARVHAGVPGQVGATREGLAAGIAHVRPLARVNAPLVRHQTPAAGEVFAAGAAVGPLAGVRPGVLQQAALHLEAFAACVAVEQVGGSREH